MTTHESLVPADPAPTRRELLGTCLRVGAAAAAPVALTACATTEAAAARPRAMEAAAPAPMRGGTACTGYGSPAFRQPLAPMQLQRRDPGPKDVDIAVLHCGVCHSDIHQVNNDWKNTLYPCVPGHEIVGRVVRVGSQVTRHKVDDVVAVGAIVDSCRTCEACTNGMEQYCEGPKGPTATYNGPYRPDGTNTFGGYSNRIVVAEHFVIPVPAALTGDVAAVPPLLCAGITTFSPLRHWNLRRGQRLAVAGLGGLGHMAVKLAKAMGARVTVVSTSPDKEADARKFGAADFVLAQDVKKMREHARKYDLVLNTIPYDHDVNAYTDLVKTGGVHVIVGLLLPHVSDNMQMVFHRRSIGASNIGSVGECHELLRFCGEHAIAATVERIPITSINDAFEKVPAKKVRYRYVIDVADSLPAS